MIIVLIKWKIENKQEQIGRFSEFLEAGSSRPGS